MRRLVFFSKNMEIGGMEKALLNLLNRFDFTQYSVTLVLEEKRGALLERLDPAIRVEEYRLSSCGIPLLRKLINFSHRMLWAARRRHTYDFSCAYCTYSIIGSRLAKYAAKNCWLYVHSDYARSLPSETAYRQFFDSLCVQTFSGAVFVSNESRASFLERYPQMEQRTCVINNLVDADEIRALAVREPAPEAVGGPVFLFVGRLEEESKRLSRLLEAFRMAREARPGVRLWIVGDGKDRDLCRTLIGSYGLADAVEMFGAQPNPYPYMRQADCLLLTSDYEGFPVVYTEALVLHKNIITTIPVSDDAMDIAAYAQLVDKDARAIAQAMVSFREHPVAPPDFSEINAARMRRLAALIAAPGGRR